MAGFNLKQQRRWIARESESLVDNGTIPREVLSLCMQDAGCRRLDVACQKGAQ
jgi:hypothetical protein